MDHKRRMSILLRLHKGMTGLGEGLDFSAMASGALSREETQGTVAGGFVLSIVVERVARVDRQCRSNQRCGAETKALPCGDWGRTKHQHGHRASQQPAAHLIVTEGVEGVVGKERVAFGLFGRCLARTQSSPSLPATRPRHIRCLDLDATPPGDGVPQGRRRSVPAVHLRARGPGPAQRSPPARPQICPRSQSPLPPTTPTLPPELTPPQFFAQRNPRYLLRVVNKHEEFYALIMLFVERHYLRKHSANRPTRTQCARAMLNIYCHLLH